MQESGEYKDVELKKLHSDLLNKIREFHPDSEHYQNLKRSIASKGYNRSMLILIGPHRDPETGEVVPDEYNICNGLHRTEACKELGLETVPCFFDARLTPETAQQWQYVLNTSVPTKLKEKFEHFKRYALTHPDKRQKDIAKDFDITQTELSRIMNYKKLVDKAKDFVDSGKIRPTAALALATVPQQYQEQFIEKAQDLPTNEFVEFITAQRKAINKALREGTKDVKTQVAQKFIGLAEAKRLLQQVINELDQTDPGEERYLILTGEKTMGEKMLCCDPETIAFKEEQKTQKAAQSKLEAARKRKEAAEAKFRELEKQAGVTESQIAESLA